MEHIQTTKQKLVFEIEQLSNPYLMELQNFIQYLKFKQSSTTATSHDRHVLRPEEDPLLHSFGLIDVPPFSETIDETLYGAV
jgi:hypothetical protein